MAPPDDIVVEMVWFEQVEGENEVGEESGNEESQGEMERMRRLGWMLKLDGDDGQRGVPFADVTESGTAANDDDAGRLQWKQAEAAWRWPGQGFI